MGYARLLDAEIEANGRALEKIRDDRLLSPSHLVVWISRMGAEAWKEVRTSLAPLLKSEDFDALDNYYRLVKELSDMKPPDQHTPPGSYGAVDRLAADLQGRTPAVRSVLSGYANLPSRVKWLGF